MANFHFTKQHDAMQCGVACLHMICRHYGVNYSIGFLSNVCRETTEGVSLFGLSKAASQLGLNTVYGRISVDKLINATLPSILHWNQNHFVILYKVKNGQTYYVADPGKGLVKFSKEEFKEHWISTKSGTQEKGIVMFLTPTIDFGKLKDQTIHNVHTLKFLSGYFAQYKQLFVYVALGLVLGCLLQLLMPFLTQMVVDVGIKHKNINFIWLVMVGQLVVVLSRTITDFIRRWLLLHISMKINVSMLSDFFIKLLKLPMSFFDVKLMGDLMQRMDDHRRIQRFLTQETINVMFSFLSIFVFGSVLCIYNKTIFGIFVIGSFLYGTWLLTFLKKRKVLDYELFDCQARNQDKSYQFVTSMQEIKLQDCEQRRREEWEDVQADLYNVQMKSLKLGQSQEAGAIFINEAKNILITVLAATAVIKCEMSLGMMLAVQYIIGQLNVPIDQLMNFLYSFQDVKISLERINEVHTIDNEDDKEHCVKSFVGGQSLTMENIQFKYDIYAKDNIIDGVSLVFPEHKMTAIVGSSGSGKTTLLKLLLGYYPVTGGKIRIGDVDISHVNLKWWRQKCGVVMQEGVIFSESIARNIAVGDDEIDVDRLKFAAKMSNIHEYVMSLPLKYNTIIGRDGVGLSQGQKQRILIARAVYKDPQYIFLDEATNALDTMNERIIVDNLDSFYKGKTVIVVAHRLSTVKSADQIVVLNSGKVVEIGNHSSLVEKKGAYYNLVKNQLELGS